MEVSVIVAVLDGARTLPRLLDSLDAQRFRDFELIVQDGGSSDGTLLILESRKSTIAHWESARDGGIYSAWNRAMTHAKGNWICFLGADDAFHDEGALASLVDAAGGAPPDVRIVYGNVRLMSGAGRPVQIIGEPWRDARAKFMRGVMIPHPGALHRRTLFRDHGYFDASYRLAGDYEFLLRELKHGDAIHVARTIVDMQVGGASARPDSIHRALREVIRAREAHGLRDMPVRLLLATAMSRIGATVYRCLGPQVFAQLADRYRLLRGRPRIWTIK